MVTAHATAGAPIHQDPAAASVSAHHSSENSRARNTSVDQPIPWSVCFMSLCRFKFI
jgi:hypothetical protein